MKPTPLRSILFAACLLLLAAPRLPAPITVPPEETPQTKVIPPEETPKKKKADAKPSIPTIDKKSTSKENRMSFAGTWSGLTTETISTTDIPSTGQQFVTVANDEKTVAIRSIYRGKENAPVHAKCQRNGDTLIIEQIYREYGVTLHCQSKLTFKNNRSASYRYDTSVISEGPAKGNKAIGTGTLTR